MAAAKPNTSTSSAVPRTGADPLVAHIQSVRDRLAIIPDTHPRRSLYVAELERLEADLAARSASAEPQPMSTPADLPSSTAQIVRFPVVWPVEARACPNAVLRSALFGVLPRAELAKRPYLRGETIVALQGITIVCEGERLDQCDLDVWEGVLHLCRHQALGERCEFTAYSFLKALGKTNSGDNRELLDLSLTRLTKTYLRIETDRYEYQGHLIASVVRDKETKRYAVTLSPEMGKMFGKAEFTQVDWAVRRALQGKPLAGWLHGFFASHAEPYPLSIEKLRELSGCSIARERDFKVKLRKALEALAKALEEHGQPFSFALEGDVLHVERTPTRSQQKHLRARKTKS